MINEKEKEKRNENEKEKEKDKENATEVEVEGNSIKITSEKAQQLETVHMIEKLKILEIENLTANVLPDSLGKC